jgi:uncharacterized protein
VKLASASSPKRRSRGIMAPGAGTDGAGEKEFALRRMLADWPALIVAYSGGVDSAYLGWVATDTLGLRALCITADSPSYPEHHRTLALRIARDFGFQHEIIRTNEMARPAYRANHADRCYHCKHELYSQLSAIARARGIDVIADGSNADDRGDYRPGRQAAREFAVVSPLDAVGLTKAEIRTLSQRAGLPTWDEPASACLSSRIPYFSEVTDEKLRMIERAETALRQLGFRVCRVRHHSHAGAQGRQEALARLEIGRAELARAVEPEIADAIDRALREIGYQHVALDLRGYRLGSLNDALRLRPV